MAPVGRGGVAAQTGSPPPALLLFLIGSPGPPWPVAGHRAGRTLGRLPVTMRKTQLVTRGMGGWVLIWPDPVGPKAPEEFRPREKRLRLLKPWG